jgi:hypothetical protein
VEHGGRGAIHHHVFDRLSKLCCAGLSKICAMGDAGDKKAIADAAAIA